MGPKEKRFLTHNFLFSVINIGTSAQFAFAIDKNSDIRNIMLIKGLDIFPYSKQKNLVVAASLNGGNTVEFFAKVTFCKNSSVSYGIT